MLATFVLAFVAAESILIESESPGPSHPTSKANTTISMKTNLSQPEKFGFATWNLRLKNSNGQGKKMVKKSKMVPTPAPTPEPVPPHIEAMASTWYEYDAMNPTAASLRNAVKEIICSRYDVAWCAIDEGFWASTLLQMESNETDQDQQPAVKPSHSHEEVLKIEAEAKAAVQQQKLQGKMQQKIDKEKAKIQQKKEKKEAQHQLKNEKKEAQQQLKKEMKDAKAAAQQQLKKEITDAKAAAKQELKGAKKGTESVPDSAEALFADDDAGII